jgi:hypothetical protein
MASAAVAENAPDLLHTAAGPRYGTARQMVVCQLWRFRKSADVEAVLGQLPDDPNVAIHAMTALRRGHRPGSGLAAPAKAARRTRR